MIKSKQDRGDRGLEDTRKNLMFSIDKLEMYFFNYLIQKEPEKLKNEEMSYYDQTSTWFGSYKNRMKVFSFSFAFVFFL